MFAPHVIRQPPTTLVLQKLTPVTPKGTTALNPSHSSEEMVGDVLCQSLRTVPTAIAEHAGGCGLQAAISHRLAAVSRSWLLPGGVLCHGSASRLPPPLSLTVP